MTGRRLGEEKSRNAQNFPPHFVLNIIPRAMYKNGCTICSIPILQIFHFLVTRAKKPRMRRTEEKEEEEEEEEEEAREEDKTKRISTYTHTHTPTHTQNTNAHTIAFLRPQQR